MRDPTLVEPRSPNDLVVNPPHGRQTRVALGLDAGVEENCTSIANGDSSTSRQHAKFRVLYGVGGSADRQEDSDTPTLQNGVSQLVAPATSRYPSTSTSGRPQPLQRAKSDFGPRHRTSRNVAILEDDLWRMRHGWEDEYTSNEYLALLNSVSS
jgi:regulatory associated protein of mTOR